MEEQCQCSMENIRKKFDLTGKVAIITGSSKGIGASIAFALAEFGAKVVISSRRKEAVDKVADQMKEAGFDCLSVACHVGDSEQRKNLVEKTIKKYGTLDILVNNAGTNPVYGTMDTLDDKVFDQIINVNLKGPFDLSNLCYPYFKKNRNGSIINISSVEGKRPSEGLGLYSVSKSALLMLTKSQAKEWGKIGIRVNAICPGLIKTKFSSALWNNEILMKMVKTNLPLRRIAEPSEISGLAVFLASEASSYCTGQSFTADGGHLVMG